MIKLQDDLYTAKTNYFLDHTTPSLLNFYDHEDNSLQIFVSTPLFNSYSELTVVWVAMSSF